jgi:hypothetical protein
MIQFLEGSGVIAQEIFSGSKARAIVKDKLLQAVSLRRPFHNSQFAYVSGPFATCC